MLINTQRGNISNYKLSVITVLSSDYSNNFLSSTGELDREHEGSEVSVANVSLEAADGDQYSGELQRYAGLPWADRTVAQ